MDDAWIEYFVEKFFTENGREPTEEEIERGYAAECDWAYDNYIDGLIDEHKMNNGKDN